MNSIKKTYKATFPLKFGVVIIALILIILVFAKPLCISAFADEHIIILYPEGYSRNIEASAPLPDEAQATLDKNLEVFCIDSDNMVTFSYIFNSEETFAFRAPQYSKYGTYKAESDNSNYVGVYSSPSNTAVQVGELEPGTYFVIKEVVKDYFGRITQNGTDYYVDLSQLRKVNSYFGETPLASVNEAVTMLAFVNDNDSIRDMDEYIELRDTVNLARSYIELDRQTEYKNLAPKLDNACIKLASALAFLKDPSGKYNSEYRFYGDANGDNTIDSKDVVTIQQYVADLKDLRKIDIVAADVNEDGQLNMKDAIWVQQYMADLLNKFPSGIIFHVI